MHPRSVAAKELTGGLQVVPNVAADLATKDAYIEQIVVCNVTGSAATITVKDKQGTPLSLLNAESIAAHDTRIFDFPQGVKMIGGINWVGGTLNALHAEIYGTVRI